MSNLQISVIIPVYGVEKYIKQCVDSVLAQTYPVIEILLVDDGSPDGCPSICDAYAAAYPHITVAHQENGGLSAARNTGIRQASGDYVLFLDGDDFWDDKNAAGRLAARVQKTGADVLHFGYEKYYEKNGRTEPYFSEKQSMPQFASKAEQLDWLTEKGLYIASAWNKMIKRDLLTKELFFEEGVYSEDIEWCAKLMLQASSFDYMYEDFYCYRQREGSITHRTGLKQCEDLCAHILACIHLTEQADPQIRKSLSRYTAYQYATFFAVQAQAETVPEDCIKRLAPYKEILSCHNGNRKLQMLSASCRAVGYKRTCALVRRGGKSMRDRA